MKKTLRISLALLLTVLLVPFTSCKKDDPEPDVIASFTFAVDATDYKKVTFTNESQNFSAVSWNFGDNSALSTETNPVHTYAAVGEFTVTLTATSEKGTTTDVYSTKVTIADPNAMLTKLVGETSKTWKLLRNVSGGAYPLEVGPIDRSSIWWAVGLNNDELAGRPCMLNDEWTFHRDGKMVFDDKGDYWAEGSIYPDDVDDMCASSTAPMVNVDGADVSAWASGTHAFEL
ncbi:MAG TPA: PKD domain-containing protein, partial [Bacteroidales bacterium]|nr:PKD domain-containing protein [Bacteroidales bacterium]